MVQRVALLPRVTFRNEQVVDCFEGDCTSVCVAAGVGVGCEGLGVASGVVLCTAHPPFEITSCSTLCHHASASIQ